MTPQIQALWTEVSKAALESLKLIESAEHGFGRTEIGTLHAAAEMHVFALCLVSHAMLRGQHDNATREQVMRECADSVEMQACAVKVEADDLEEFVRARTDQYFDWFKLAGKDELIDGWLRMLRNNLAAAWNDDTLRRIPRFALLADMRYRGRDVTYIMPSFVRDSDLQARADLCLNRVLMPLYEAVGRLCERSKNMFSLSTAEISLILAPASSPAD